MGEASLGISVIGGCTISDSRGNALPVKSRKARALLGVLALTPNMVLSRDRLAGLFWSDFEDEKARASLRQTLKLLRDELGQAADVIVADRELLALDRAKVSCDVNTLADLAEAGHFGHLLFNTECLHDQLFAGLAELDEGFSVWVAVYREQVRRRLLSLMERAMAGTDWQAGMAAAAALLRLDPSHEPALRCLMRHEVKAGNRLEAARLYRAFRARLEEDFGASPERETVLLHRQITEAGDAPALPPASSAQAPAARLPALGILSAGNNDAATNGLAGDLVAALARFRTFTLSRIDAGIGSAGAGCDYVAALTFAPGPGGGTLAIELTEASGGATIWSRTLGLSGEGAGWREALVRGICGALNVYISESQIRQLRLKNPESHTLTEKWMRGRQLLELWQPEADAEAERLFLECIHLTPDHAPLHSGLADIYNVRHIVFPGTWRDRALEGKAMRLARRAVALDPLEPAAHVTLGWSLAMAGKAAQAAYSFQHGHELNPADPSLAMSAAHGLAICGELDQAIALSRAAFAAHPAPPWLFWGFDANIRFLAGDYAGAMASVDRSGEIKANFLGWKCAAAGHMGNGQAKAITEDFIERTTERWSTSKSPTPADIARWFLHIFPFGREQERQRLKEGLELAGLPVG